MHTLKLSALLIFISLLFAGAILLAAKWLDGTGYTEPAIYALIALWWIPFIYLCGCSVKHSSSKHNPAKKK